MNRTLVWVAAFVAQSALIPAQALQRDQAPTLAGTASIRGRVVAADTGAPIRDNVVTLTAVETSAPLATRTDGEGRFRFTDLAAGRYRLRVSVGPTSARYLAEERALELADKQLLDKLEIKLRRAGAIAGRVLDEYGEPVALTRIRVFKVEGGRQREFSAGAGGSWAGFGSLTMTDDFGRFRVFALTPGDYVIAADPSLTPTAGDAAVTARQLVTYYPGTANATEAGPIKVGGGDEITGIEWPIVRGGTYEITGTIVDSRGQPLAGASITVMARVSDGGFRGTGVKAATDGTFAARNVVAGDYFLVVRPTFLTKDMPPDAEFAVHPVTVTADVEGVLLTTRRGATVTGTVIFDAASGTPPSRATVLPVAIDQQPRPTGLPPSSPVADDGGFRLSHVFGPVLLRVSGAAGWSLESVTADGREISDVPTDFGTGMSGVTITMTKRGATLSGVVLDADRNPIPDATVLLFGEPPSAWHMRCSTTRSAISEADGRFTLTAVRPGAYFVAAVRRADLPGASLTASDFERLSKLAARVELRDGQTRTLDLEAIPSPR